MSVKENVSRVNGIDMNVLKETVSAVKGDPELGQCRFRARNMWIDANHNRSTITGFYGAKQEIAHEQEFQLHADEPPILAGEDQAANPVEHLLHALASCVTTSLVAHAAVHGIHIEEVESELEGDIDLSGFLGLAPSMPKGYTNIRMKLKVKSDERDVERLKRLAEFSPVYNTLTHGVKVDLQIEPK